MRGAILAIIFILLASGVSADIIFTPLPQNIYNLGDTISVPVTVKAPLDTGISGDFNMNLVCNGNQINFNKNGISLSSNQEINVNGLLILKKNIIGNLAGTCFIKATLGSDSATTNPFEVSTAINLSVKNPQRSFNPGDTITVEGNALKANGNPANGFIDIKVISGNETNITSKSTINNGQFSVSVQIPKDSKAGEYLVSLKGYEKDSSGEITNNGETNYIITINQVPTSLEIIFDNSTVQPGADMRVKTVLHDQTGQSINSTSIITVKDAKNDILEQIESPTEKFINYSIDYNQKPEKWSVVAISNRLSSQADFSIAEKEDAKVEVVNRTLIITNVGNVVYNKTLLIKIGNESLNINPMLKVDGVKKYELSAPEGEYTIQIIDDGKTQFEKQLSLTGNAIGISEVSGGIFNSRFFLIWIFLAIVLGFILFLFLRKGYRKSFIGHISKRKEKTEAHGADFKKKHFAINTENRAELSLSIKGEKQNANLICLKIKNLKEIEKDSDASKETLGSIASLVENNNGYVYENGENIFFLFVPLMTKTFKNEKPTAKTALEIKKLLAEHNKKFRQKIDFGISVNSGDLISAKSPQGLKFMSLGTLMSFSKKLAALSGGEVYLGGKVKEKLMTSAKMDKHHKDGVEFYTIKEIREDNGEKGKFISEFMKRLER